MFNRSVKISISKALHDKLSAIAEMGGYANTNELISHILDKEADKLSDTSLDSRDEEIVKQQLRGLGYIE